MVPARPRPSACCGGLLTPDFRARHLPRLRHPHRHGQDQATRRLHDPALQSLPGSVRARESRIHRFASLGFRMRRGSAKAMIERLGLGRTRGADCRLAVRRLEAASCRSAACTLPKPAAAAAGRADGGGGSQGAGANFGARSTRSPPRGSPCWCRPITWMKRSVATKSRISPMASCSPAARVEEVIAHSGLVTYVVSGEEPAKLAAGARRQARGRDGRAVRHQLAYLRS